MTDVQRFMFRYPALNHTRFSNDDAASLIGQRPRADRDGARIDVVIVDAQVVDDGAAIDLTIEVPIDDEDDA